MEKAVTQLTPPGFHSARPALYQPFSVPPSLLSSEPVFPSSVAESALSDEEDFALGRDATRRSPLEDDEFRPSIDALKYAHGPALSPKPEISEYQVAYVS